MKTNLFSLSILLISLLYLMGCKQTIESSSQDLPKNLTVKDSIRLFSDSLFYALEENYLHRNTTDWNKAKAQYTDQYLQSKTFNEALYGFQVFFDSIGCDHCQIFYGDNFVKGTSKPLSYQDYNAEFGRKHYNGVKFSVSLLKDKYGFIQMPGMFYPNLPKDSIDLKSQKMYDNIVELDKNNKIDGWILDLRFNIGGDAYLMLAALYHFLGDRVVYTGLDADMAIAKINKLDKGKFFSGNTIEREIHPTVKSNLEVPIVLLIGNFTASAGEDVTVSFTDRNNVITIGEPTYGFLTGNDLFKLPFGAQAALTISYIADLNGSYKEYLIPEISVDEETGYNSDYLKDENILEAIKYIDSKN